MSQPKQGNYFMLPNEIFNMDLTAEEIALYAFLMRMEDRKTFTCYPAFKTIGEALKMGSKNTVMKYVRLLEEKELIETEHTVVEHHDGSLRNGYQNRVANRRKHRRCSAAPVRFTAAGNADRKPFLRVSCAVFLG